MREFIPRENNAGCLFGFARLLNNLMPFERNAHTRMRLRGTMREITNFSRVENARR